MNLSAWSVLPAAEPARRQWFEKAGGWLTVALLPVLTGLTGCATPAGTQGSPASEYGPRQWRGRFQLITPQRQTGRFILSHLKKGRNRDQPERFELELLTPIGSTAALLVATPGQASLDLSDGRRFEAASLEELTSRTLGWIVPLEQLPGWLDQLGRGETIQHPQWQVVTEQAEPLRILLSGPSQVQLRLLFDPRDAPL